MTQSRLRVAAVQMQPVLGDVDANLRSADMLIRRAFEQGAQWVILPEFFTSGVAFHPKMLDERVRWMASRSGCCRDCLDTITALSAARFWPSAETRSLTHSCWFFLMARC